MQPFGGGTALLMGSVPNGSVAQLRNPDGLVVLHNGMPAPVVRQYGIFSELHQLARTLVSTVVAWRWVVSFSLYGTSPRYTVGALENARLMADYYTGWEMWVYHDESVPDHVLSDLRRHACVRLINMQGHALKSRMSWRFLVASEPTVARYVVRDIDSRLSAREAAAVAEWVGLGKRFHVMRDHPSHSNYAMSGGMWGGLSTAVPGMGALLAQRNLNDEYLTDMDFLNRVVWPLAEKSVLQHDAFSCERFGGGVGFPLPRIAWEHVGGVYVEGALRDGDVKILRDATPPAACIRAATGEKAPAAMGRRQNTAHVVSQLKRQTCRAKEALLSIVDRLPQEVWYSTARATTADIKRQGDCTATLTVDLVIDKDQAQVFAESLRLVLAGDGGAGARLVQFQRPLANVSLPLGIDGLATTDQWFWGESDSTRTSMRLLPLSEDGDACAEPHANIRFVKRKPRHRCFLGDQATYCMDDFEGQLDRGFKSRAWRTRPDPVSATEDVFRSHEHLPFFRRCIGPITGLPVGEEDSEPARTVKRRDLRGGGAGLEDSDLTIVHQTKKQRLFDSEACESIRANCRVLNGGVWRECAPEATESWLRERQPCADHAFIAKIHDAHIADNRPHKAVPGTIFTDRSVLLWQPYVRSVPAGPPSAWSPAVQPWTVHRYECLASVLQAFPRDRNRFPHETFPRLLYLLQHIPFACNVLVAVDPFVQEYLDLLTEEQQARIVPWEGEGHVYHGTYVYVANEGPYCADELLSAGGISTFFQPEVMNTVRQHLFIPTRRRRRPSQDVAVVAHRPDSHTYAAHEELLRLLESEYDQVLVYAEDDPLDKKIQMFSSADLVVGPNGPALANLVFARPGTRVVEIGWRGDDMDNMFSRAASALGLSYRLVVGTANSGGRKVMAPLVDVSENCKLPEVWPTVAQPATTRLSSPPKDPLAMRLKPSRRVARQNATQPRVSTREQRDAPASPRRQSSATAPPSTAKADHAHTPGTPPAQADGAHAASGAQKKVPLGVRRGQPDVRPTPAQ